MTLLAVILAGTTILIVGIVVGYLWGSDDGYDRGVAESYRAVERYYQGRVGR